MILKQNHKVLKLTEHLVKVVIEAVEDVVVNVEDVVVTVEDVVVTVEVVVVIVEDVVVIVEVVAVIAEVVVEQDQELPLLLMMKVMKLQNVLIERESTMKKTLMLLITVMKEDLVLAVVLEMLKERMVTEKVTGEIKSMDNTVRKLPTKTVKFLLKQLLLRLQL